MKLKRIEILINILFWAFFTWFFVFGSVTNDAAGTEVIEGKERTILVRNELRLYTFLVLQAIAIFFVYIELNFIHQLQRPKSVSVFVLKTILLFFCSFFLQILLAYLINRHDENLSKFKVIQSFNILSIMNIFYFAVAICYGFTKKWIVDEKDKQQLELIKNQAELNLLRQQLQPHFLFNTMNNLMAMVDQRDNPKLAQGIDKLSGLLRFVVYDIKNEKVVITDEIKFLKNFAELHLLRFEDDEIDFKIKTSGSFDTQFIEPGIFLCYVENAFKHGVQPEENAFIHINIDLSKKDTVVFSIENSIPEVPFENESGGFGLKSNQERLDLAYPHKHSIVFKRNETYKVELTINTDD